MFKAFANWAKSRGGVHPVGHKESAVSAIKSATLPEKLFIPLRQHAGASAIPIVNVGDYVLKGQLIAVAPTEVSAPVHASSSGTVTDITDIVAPHPSGHTAPAIIIETDGKDQWQDVGDIEDPFKAPPLSLADKVAQAGIVGMGGAIFPAAVKLKQGAKHEIKTVLVNGSECEPYLTCDDRLMREKAEKIITGARLVRYILQAYRVVIAIEDNKPEAIKAIQEAAAPFGSVEVHVVPAKYPMGSAKQLIQWVTGREVPAGARSTSVGTLVHNVGTIYAIYEALVLGRPLISRVVTVAGGAIKTPSNIEALIGTPISNIIDECEGLKTSPSQIIMGGPMMGMPIPSSDAPMIKGATGILAFTKDEMPSKKQSPCIRCTSCVKACPMGLLPLEMATRVNAEDFDSAADYGLKDCILCGACAYVCPSHIPLVQYFQFAKGKQAIARDAKKKMEYTVDLSVAKQERVEAEKAAKAAEKAAKKAARAKASKARKNRADATKEESNE
ncbi:MAG: electron transport complex subunit RsxC [Pseudomonadota bacterium]